MSKRKLYFVWNSILTHININVNINTLISAISQVINVANTVAQILLLLLSKPSRGAVNSIEQYCSDFLWTSLAANTSELETYMLVLY
jgi:hypothetical protein